ncbi:hypothetical protein M427DRAFT_57169 [Gonapodya prolifera JEL478]|uniref:Uncharacterized protein n=1 Tax=Gonapodya prolifera (strain JEL478) TaxID=1344416 RepID=A0A139AEL5_GONPJ|nr:hypothetical protein M427DRAFT_57169 [Gonapodya prolifera JEL478]|eukprot:KXS15034.1 hypothetical protein M427DRAFT_57169 [Gonapodya prolifera JEL478]
MEMQILAGESCLLKQCTCNSSLGNCFSTNCISSMPVTLKNALWCLSNKIGVWTRKGSGDSKELLELERMPLAKKWQTVAKDACYMLRDIKDLMDKKEQEQRGEANQTMRDLLVQLIEPLQPAKSSNNIIT